MEQQLHRTCERTKSKQKPNQVMSHSNRSRVLLFDLAHKHCNGIIKGWIHCLTSWSKGRFVSNMNVWVSMMSGHGANPMVPAGNKANRLSSVNHTTKTIYQKPTYFVKLAVTKTLAYLH